MATTIQLRRDTATNWTSVNPILAEGEMGVVLDDFSYKIGNGTTAWNSLPARELTGIFDSAILMNAVSNPSVPGANSAYVYIHNVAGRMMLKTMGPSGLDNPLQNALYANSMYYISPGVASGLFTTLGVNAVSSVGTVASINVTAGVNLKNSMRRASVASATTANSASELRVAAAMCYRGEVFGSVPTGGFFMSHRWGILTTTALQRQAHGLFSTSAALSTTLSPSASTSCIFVGNDSADTNLQLMHNDAAGNCTKIDLGANFPASNTTACYELILFCPPNGDSVGYRITRMDTGNVVAGTITTDLPPKSTLLTWHQYANNGGTAAATTPEFIRFYMESDF